ncbi:MBL fold metallo-hydrolase [Candidatus Latescibacterota bacterium]
MRVTFWGTRGSIPKPMIADEFRIKIKRLLMNAHNVDLSDEAAVDNYLDNSPFPDGMTFGGNTPCLEINEGSHQILLDCGSGMRNLGHHMMNTGFTPGGRIDILQTHTHWDHIMGFPFFVPAYIKNTEIHIYGVHPHLRERFEQQMDLIHFPITMNEMGSHITFHQLIEEEELTLGPFSIKNKGLVHPGGSYAYRITTGGKTVVFATDGEYKEPSDEVFIPYINFFREADILIFDAMYASLMKTIERENFGHSTAAIGVGIALNAGVKKLVLFHHDPESSDTDIANSFFKAKQLLESRSTSRSNNSLEIITAYDSLEIEV